jgi:hypothetical protein
LRDAKARREEVQPGDLQHRLVAALEHGERRPEPLLCPPAAAKHLMSTNIAREDVAKCERHGEAERHDRAAGLIAFAFDLEPGVGA